MEEVLDAICNGERELAGLHAQVLSRRRTPHRARNTDQAEGVGDRLPAARPGRRSGHRPADSRPHRQIRPVPAAWRGRRRQHRVASGRPAAGRPDGREGRGAAGRQGARPASAGQRREDGPAGLRDERALRRRTCSSARRPTIDKAAEKPKRASLFASMSEADVTLDEALRLLSLPRELGRHPDDGGASSPTSAASARTSSTATSSVRWRAKTRCSRSRWTRPLTLLAEPKKSRRRQSAAKSVLREVGTHPQSGAAINLLDGRYGPYVTDGTTNASLPKGASPDQVTMEQAVALLRRAPGRRRRPAPPGVPRRGHARRRGGRRSTPRPGRALR